MVRRKLFGLATNTVVARHCTVKKAIGSRPKYNSGIGKYSLSFYRYKSDGVEPSVTLPNPIILQDEHKTIHLLGTAHISETSACQVRKLIRRVQPQQVHKKPTIRQWRMKKTPLGGCRVGCG